MSEQLIIGLSLTDEDHAQWLIVDATGRAHGHVSRGALDNAAAMAGEREVVVVLHDTGITRTTCNLPVSGNKLTQALPYALEDQFAEDVERLHFAAGKPDDNGDRQVAVIARSTLEHCVTRLADLGVSPVAVYTSHDALTELDGFAQLLVSDDKVILRAPDGQFAGLEGVAPLDIFQAWQATQQDEADAEPVHVRVYCDESSRDKFANDWQAIADGVADIDIKALGDGWLPLVARAIAGNRGINLLQGRFAIKSDSLARFRPWLAAAAMLGAVLVLSVINRFVDYRTLDRQSLALDTELGLALASVQPGGANAANPEAQLRALLNRSKRGSGAGSGDVAEQAAFLSTLAAFAKAAVDNKATAIEAISYRNGVFDVRLTTPDTTTLEALTRQVSTGGDLDAKIQRTEQQDDTVKSFVQISQVRP